MSARFLTLLLLVLLTRPVFLCCSASEATTATTAPHACCQQSAGSESEVPSESGRECHCLSGSDAREAPAKGAIVPEPGAASAFIAVAPATIRSPELSKIPNLAPWGSDPPGSPPRTSIRLALKNSWII